MGMRRKLQFSDMQLEIYHMRSAILQINSAPKVAAKILCLNCEKLAEEVELFDGQSPTKIVMYVVCC